VRKKLSKSLSKAPSLTEVVVTVSDINGPRGGEDKQCQLQFAVAGKGRFVIKDIKADMYHAIDSAVHRAEHAMAKANARRHKDRHLRNGRAHKRSAWIVDSQQEQAAIA
jgi:ribosome-associated translation inhibitor RaiA